ncbi:unnamed protein product [Cylindrotheca closterium]|uniref:DUF202 domain-containing protein n=1 Tax=Cylindrotheca closterium TaxID=2856 RepID=A0AAD2JM87_9STRA|nr:unnamed protein product [Cylindrotheca closterium]
MAGKGEKTPLLSGGENQNYYFLNPLKKVFSQFGDGDEGETVEDLPPGATAEDFEPRMLGASSKGLPRTPVLNQASKEPGFFGKLFGGASKPKQERIQLKPRKAPIKIEPKVFFANERTFLAWMHVSIILAGASIAILAFSNTKKSTPGSQLYGLIMLPVAVCFIVYSMYQYMRRAYMIRNKHPGPYDDTVGPTVLGIILMMSIVGQFVIKLNAIVS